MKKLLSTLLAVMAIFACVFTAVSCGGNSEDKKGLNQLEYELSEDGKSYSVVGMGECKDADIVIPAEYNGLPVTSIGERAFRVCMSLTSVVIPDSVISIGSNAFSYCHLLLNITIPDSVTYIGSCAFYYCFSLIIYCETQIKPDNWDEDWNCNETNPSHSSFCPTVWDCKNNDKDDNGYEYSVIDGIRYSFKDGIATLIKQPFKIETASILEYVNYKGMEYTVSSIISEYAFSECVSLTSITIPGSVTSIGKCAFFDCGKLTDINFNGTIEQWNAIKKSPDWNKNLKDYTIHCTDGDIKNKTK